MQSRKRMVRWMWTRTQSQNVEDEKGEMSSWTCVKRARTRLKKVGKRSWRSSNEEGMTCCQNMKNAEEVSTTTEFGGQVGTVQETSERKDQNGD